MSAHRPDPSSTTQEDCQGRTVGSCELIRRVGSGGMGTVYLAEHVRTGRPVAVKLLRTELSDRPDITRRFLAEARAMGRVSHPGIVSILDLDELPDGTPYLVMEYLHGLSLREYLRALKAPPPIATSLRILYEVAEAMAAAHAAGVTHRDLSPANIMLLGAEDSGFGPIKILDFGLARLHTPDGASDPSLSTTRDGAVLGTLKYMAPEQCLDPHSVDGQADVYGLGVIGYELIAGRPPFSAPTGWELISLHLREPPPPLPLDGRGDVPQALGPLVLEMLAKSPLARPDMTQVAARLRALLPAEQAPLRSVAPRSQPTLLRKGRGRALAPLLGAIVGLGLLGALGASGLYVRAQRRSAETRRSEVLAASAEVLDVINRSLRSIPGATRASQALLDTTERLLGGSSRQVAADPETAHAVIRLHTLRGELARNHGVLADSRRAFERAIALSEELVRAQPERDAYRAQLATAYDGLADTLEQLSDLGLAKAAYEKALSLRIELHRLAPDDPARVQAVVGSFLLRGDLLRTQGLQRAALLDLQQARGLLEPLWKREPDKKSYRWQMCGVLYRLSQTLLSLGKLADSLVEAERALDLLRHIAPSDQQGASYHLLLARVLQSRGDTRVRLGRMQEAEEDYQQSLDMVRGLLKASPLDVQCRRALVDGGYKALDHALRLGKLDAAEALAAQIQSTAEALFQTDSVHQGHRWRLAGSLQRAGDVALARGRPDEARRLFQRALELQESLRAQSPDSSRHRDRTVWIWERQGDAAARGSFPEQASTPWSQALAVLDALEAADPATTDVRLGVARILRKRGGLRARLGQLAEARTDWERAAQRVDALIALDAADGAAMRESILLEYTRANALVAAGGLPPELAERAAGARRRAAALREQGLFAGDTELAAAARALQSP